MGEEKQHLEKLVSKYLFHNALDYSKEMIAIEPKLIDFE